MASTRRPKRAPRITCYPHYILPSAPVKLTLAQLCGLYRLPIEINKRDADVTWAPPIYAALRGTDIRELREDGTLSNVYVGASGDGKTPRQALKNLAANLSNQTISIGFPAEKRCEVKLPVIVL